MKHTVESALSTLRKKSGVRSVDTANKVITLDRDNSSLGNKSWGKLDYLRNHEKFVIVYE